LIGEKGKKQKSMADVPVAEVCQYTCEDADITFRLKDIWKKNYRRPVPPGCLQIWRCRCLAYDRDGKKRSEDRFQFSGKNVAGTGNCSAEVEKQIYQKPDQSSTSILLNS